MDGLRKLNNQEIYNFYNSTNIHTVNKYRLNGNDAGYSVQEEISSQYEL